MKKIVCFDGDGTLWYPAETAWTKRPHWIYEAHPDPVDYLPRLIKPDGALELVQHLVSVGCKVCILSTHPDPTGSGHDELIAKITHLGYAPYIWKAEVVVSDPAIKGVRLDQLRQDIGASKRDALMVGDSSRFDYGSARSSNLPAVLLESDYRAEYEDGRRARRIANGFTDLYRFL